LVREENLGQVGRKPHGRIKPPGRCVFCEGGDLTKEHFWPDWASALLPKYAGNLRVEQFLTITERTRLAAPPDVSSRQGQTWTKKIRAVCRSCNNGWMSALESAAKPILTPLITTQEHILTVEAMTTLAQWIALKVMVGERNHPEESVTPLEDRAKFRTALEIPQNFRTWIGKCGTGGWESGYLRHAATIGTSPIVMPHHRFKNIHSVAFGIGDLFVFVIHTTVNRVLHSNPSQSVALIPIFPAAGPCAWPPPRSLSVSEANNTANALDRSFRSPRFRWAPGFPN